jgi:Antitoxin-like ribbon-helix-helix
MRAWLSTTLPASHRLSWRALKMLAVEKDTALNALAVEAFNDLLKRHGKRQSVENPLLD